MDSDRLDWMIKNKCVIKHGVNGYWIDFLMAGKFQSESFSTAREAIDAAMDQEDGKNG